MGLFDRKQVTCADVVRAYGRVISVPARNATLTYPASKLPFEEGLIKEALCRVTVEGSTVPREQLRVAFMQLASFVVDHDDRSLPEAPNPNASAEEQTAFAQRVLEVIGGAPEKHETISNKMESLAREFEARCRFIEIAEEPE